MSSVVNKAKAAVSSNKSGNNAQVDNPESSNVGPHKSEMMNKLDPRVDSDRDHRNDPLSHAGGKGQVQQAPAGVHRTSAGTGTTATTTGVAGTTSGNASTGMHGTRGTAGSGLQGTHASSATPGSGNAANAGPHNSAAMNKMDPRVDSDMDHSKTTGGNATMR